MKTLTGLLALTTAITFLSCSAKKPHIAVGMTYDEVEKTLGKPSEITRGVSDLIVDNGWESSVKLAVDSLTSGIYSSVPDFMMSGILADVELDMIAADSSARASGDTLSWIFPQTTETTGQLLYVTWWFPKTRKVDTFHVFYFRPIKNPSDKFGFDPVSIQKPPIRKYYAVVQHYAIVFDASSGRVVTSGYQPTLVAECRP